MQAELEQLYFQAQQRENRVAFGAEQYELQHEADDSESENEGDADDSYEEFN